MSKQTTYPKYDLLGVPVDGLTIRQANDYIVAWAQNPNLAAGYIVKPYVEFIDCAAGDPKIRRLLDGAELSLPDGVALSWAAHYLYAGDHTFGRLLKTLISIVAKPKTLNHPLPERFAGINATWSLLEACQHHQLRVFLIGSPINGSIQATKTAIEHRLPGIIIAGTLPGAIHNLHHEALKASATTIDLTDWVSAIETSAADVILVGMGFPLQEQLMARLATQLHHGVLVGEGGTFDYRSFGGRQTRAPKLVQTIGLEWLWRLILNPRRLGRQLAIPRFIWRIWRASR